MCNEYSRHATAVSPNDWCSTECSTYFPTSHNGNKRAPIAAIYLELILKERGQIFFRFKGFPHRLGERPSRRLTQQAQVHDLIFALEYPHFVEQRLQWLDSPMVNNLLQLVRRDSRPVKVSVEGGPRSIESRNVGVDFGSARDNLGQNFTDLFDVPGL